jgi:hypothetical protein
MTHLPESASPSQNPDEKCDCDCHAETKTWKECFWCANQHSYLQALAANKPDIAESASSSEPRPVEILVRKCMEAAVMLAFTRHNIEPEEDTATVEEIAADAAGACFGEETCSDEPIPELQQLLKSWAAEPRRDEREALDELQLAHAVIEDLKQALHNIAKLGGLPKELAKAALERCSEAARTGVASDDLPSDEFFDRLRQEERAKTVPDNQQTVQKFAAIKEVLEAAYTFVQKSNDEGASELYAYLEGAQENLHELSRAARASAAPRPQTPNESCPTCYSSNREGLGFVETDSQEFGEKYKLCANSWHASLPQPSAGQIKGTCEFRWHNNDDGSRRIHTEGSYCMNWRPSAASEGESNAKRRS